MMQKAAGDYDGALRSLTSPQRNIRATAWLLNQIGRIQFLQRRYRGCRCGSAEARSTIDPEDLQAHYNLMLCYRGLGRPADAEREQQLFRRFKADESSQAITESRAF